MNVDGISKGVGLEQVRAALLKCNAKGGAVAVMHCHTCRLEHQEFAAIDPLANRLYVVGQRIGEASLMQPHTNPGVAFLHQNNRAQTRLLETRREQHRQVQARRDPCVEDAVRSANLLPASAE